MTNRLRWVGLAVILLLEACGAGSGSSTSVVPPSGLSYASPQTYVAGTAIQSLSPTVSGSVTSYAVSPPLPAGLNLNPSTGVISGTPTAATATASYTVTAQNSAGQSTFGVSITVGAASVILLSGDISRSVVSGTSVSVDVSIRANFSIPGNLYAKATDATGAFLSNVTVQSAGGGVYTLELTTSNTASEGAHSATVTLNLCEDAACQTPARVPSGRGAVLGEGQDGGQRVAREQPDDARPVDGRGRLDDVPGQRGAHRLRARDREARLVQHPLADRGSGAGRSQRVLLPHPQLGDHLGRTTVVGQFEICSPCADPCDRLQ